jgi:hypothetical protein
MKDTVTVQRKDVLMVAKLKVSTEQRRLTERLFLKQRPVPFLPKFVESFRVV